MHGLGCTLVGTYNLLISVMEAKISATISITNKFTHLVSNGIQSVEDLLSLTKFKGNLFEKGGPLNHNRRPKSEVTKV